MKIALYSRELTPNNLLKMNDIVEYFFNGEFTVYAHHHLSEVGLVKQQVAPAFYYESIRDIEEELDFVVCLGGDGTMLDTISCVHKTNIPIIGINLGRLGFLTNINYSKIQESIDEIVGSKKYSIQDRMMLELEEEIEGLNMHALNEITVQKANSANLIVIHAYVDNHFLCSYWADGLIISTPTGSTAYSLSVGGPILSPNCDNIVITPIAPHNLTMRPIVLPASSKLRLEIESRDEKFLVSTDSNIVPVDIAHNTLHIEQSIHSVSTVQLDSSNFFDTIRKKLMWGRDTRN